MSFKNRQKEDQRRGTITYGMSANVLDTPLNPRELESNSGSEMFGIVPIGGG